LAGKFSLLNQDGTGQTNITNNAATESGPSWAPDGAKMVFATNRDGNFEIYRMNSEGDQNPTRITNNSASDSQPSYSPDGTSIVFVSTRDGNNEMYKMNADGTNQVRLTNSTTGDVPCVFARWL
jgi:TolB protein